MMLIETEVKPSGIHGLGCFTLERIPKGTVVWKLDPRFDLLIPFEETEIHPVPVRNFFRTYSYAVMLEGRKYQVLCADNARYMNHSDHPNLAEAGKYNELNIAIRDIEAGEELTADYRLFDADAATKIKVY